MKKLLLIVMAVAIFCWSFPKPMESATNYNVLLIHGAYGSDQGFLSGLVDSAKLSEAYYASKPLDNGAQIGRYDEAEDAKTHRLLYWLGPKIFEENYPTNQRISRIYQYRSFSNPANSSDNNAVELGDRTWHLPGTPFNKRRAMIEEAQEVKALSVLNDEGERVFGQAALEIIRKDPDLYRQLASRYILIGHSMGGVVSCEWIQNSDYYHGEVDKVITLDSPHEGTGALNMQLDLTNVLRAGLEGVTGSGSLMAAIATAAWIAGKDPGLLVVAAIGLGGSMTLAVNNLLMGSLVALKLEDYETSDSIVCYVDPHFNKNSIVQM